MSTAFSTQADTLPAQLYEVAARLQAAELAYNADPLNTSNPLFTAFNNCAIDVDFENQTVSVTATLPMSFGTNAAGSIYVDVVDYLV